MAFGVNQKGKPEGRANSTLIAWGRQVTPFVGVARWEVGGKGCLRVGVGTDLVLGAS